MNAQTIVAICASLLAAGVSVTIPMWTFKRTLQHERLKWVRDQRAQLYADMLTEAYAELQYFVEEMSRLEIAMVEAQDPQLRDASQLDEMKSGPDLRLGPVERAKLGSRGNLFASKQATIAFNTLQGHMARASLLKPKSEGEVFAARFRAEEMWEAFQKVVRDELGANDL